jgi:L-aspartate oxidase
MRNLAACADLIVRSALARQDSRGLHYTLDHPQTNDEVAPTILPGRTP